MLALACVAKLRTASNEQKIVSVNKNGTGKVENKALCQKILNISLT